MPFGSSFKLLCVLLIFKASLAFADNTATQERHRQFQEPEKTGETIVFQWQGGFWQYQSVTGNFRVVITKAPENEANKLYLQWWRESEDLRELSYSLSVKELNVSPAFGFDAVTCINEACDDLALTAVHAFEGYKQGIRLKLDGLGSYQFSFE